MIERDAALPDPFLVLERHDTLAGYARAYGDRLAEHYESRGVVVVPHLPVACDLEFLQGLEFPAAWKKIGTANGIEAPVIVRRGRRVGVDREHPFMELLKDVPLACYLQSQVAAFDAQLRLALRALFPRYASLEERNISWRLTETRDEGMHFDVFDRGRPLGAELKRRHRVKIFVNIDAAPRVWRVSRDLPGALAAHRAGLPEALPDDINVVASVIDKLGVLDDAPAHRVAYPALAAVIVNAELVAHEVVSGRRLVAGEFTCEVGDMLDPSKHSHDCLPRWLAEAGYRIAPDAAAVAHEYRDMLGSYELQRLRAAEAAGKAAA